jgi:hypothetical protein
MAGQQIHLLSCGGNELGALKQVDRENSPLLAVPFNRDKGSGIGGGWMFLHDESGRGADIARPIVRLACAKTKNVSAQLEGHAMFAQQQHKIDHY